MTERIFAGEARGLQRLRQLTKPHSHGGTCHLRSQGDDVAKAILHVMQLGPLHEPVSIHIWEVQRQPRQRFNHASGKIVVAKSREQDGGWIEQPPAQVPELLVAKRTKHAR